jgi:amino acid permease
MEEKKPPDTAIFRDSTDILVFILLTIIFTIIAAQISFSDFFQLVCQVGMFVPSYLAYRFFFKTKSNTED